MIYYIYHVEGVKYGCTNNPERRAKQTKKRYGNVNFEVVEEFEDIQQASKREIELNQKYNTADRKPYSEMVEMQKGIKYNTGSAHQNYGQDVTGAKNPNYGNAWTDSQKDHLSVMNSNPSEETRKKMSEAWKSKPLVTCPHCGLISNNKGNMNRWHFDNCKSI